MTDLTSPMSYPQPPNQPWQPPVSQPFPQPMPPPISQPFPQPMSQPVSHPFPQQQQYPQPFPRQPKRRARIVLLIACVVAFAGAAVFGGLYVNAVGDHDAAVEQLDKERGELADVRARVSTTAEERTAAEKRNTDLEAERTALSACAKAVQHYLWDGLEGTARQTAFDAMYDACQ